MGFYAQLCSNLDEQCDTVSDASLIGNVLIILKGLLQIIMRLKISAIFPKLQISKWHNCLFHIWSTHWGLKV